jgi:hypothetical protein
MQVSAQAGGPFMHAPQSQAPPRSLGEARIATRQIAGRHAPAVVGNADTQDPVPRIAVTDQHRRFPGLGVFFYVDKTLLRNTKALELLVRVEGIEA